MKMLIAQEQRSDMFWTPSAILPVMTYGTTEHLALENSQTFAPPTSSSSVSHSWKRGFLAGTWRLVSLPATHSLFGRLPGCCVLLHSWKSTRQENAANTSALPKCPLHTLGWEAHFPTPTNTHTHTHIHHPSPSG